MDQSDHCVVQTPHGLRSGLDRRPGCVGLRLIAKAYYGHKQMAAIGIGVKAAVAPALEDRSAGHGKVRRDQLGDKGRPCRVETWPGYARFEIELVQKLWHALPPPGALDPGRTYTRPFAKNKAMVTFTTSEGRA